MNRIFFIAMLCFLVASSASAKPKGKDKTPATATVAVDCSKGQSITKALDRPAAELTIEISGICQEDVLILRRHNVILRGSDPLLDGIRSVSGDPFRISYSNITMQNLKITGSANNGIVIADGGATLINTRVEGNGAFGLMAWRSFVIAEDAVFTGNGFGGVAISGSTPARLDCTNCIIEANPMPGSGNALMVRRGSNVRFRGGVLEGRTGLWVFAAGQIDLDNTQVTGSYASIDADEHARVYAGWGTTLDGPFSIGTKSSLTLHGVTQRSATMPNSLFSDAYLNTGAGTTLMDTDITDFSNASFRDNTFLGALTCSLGSNAFCEPTVSKASSSCSLCPPPP